MSEWRECKLGDVTELVNGFAFKSDDFSNKGTPVVKIKNVASGKLLLSDVQYYPYEITDKLKPFVLRENDILVAMTGSHVHQPSSMVGRVTRYDRPFIALLNQRVGKIVSKEPDTLNENFIYYFLKQEDVTIDLATNAGGSANQANISSEQIRNFPIFLPPISEQRAIAGVLSSLDDKIDLLHRQNKTLEGMAEAVFRHFFVDNRKTTWRECIVSELADHEKTSIHPNRNPDTIFYHYSIPAFDETHMPVQELGALILSNKYKVIKNTILFSKLNPHRNKRIWLIPNSISINSICSTEFQVMCPKAEKYLFFLYGFINHPENYDEIAAGVGGTSGSHQRIDPEVIFKFKCFLPDDGTLTKYHEIVEPIFAKIHHNRQSIQTLIHQRDLLLPKLMSGEVRMGIKEGLL